MATLADVSRIGASLPGTTESRTRQFTLSVGVKGKQKGYAWTWLERVDPKKPRVPNPAVLAIRVADLGTKDLIIASDARKFFTEPHYNGYAAVLVRLAAVRVPQLRQLLTDAHGCLVPRQDAGRSGRGRRGLQNP